ncbi:MAG: hypothetical protein ACLFQV_08855 [Vulcanimicrobiota bacterium]
MFNKVKEFFELLFVGVVNMVYNLFLSLYENILFARNKWWRQLRWEFARNYLLAQIKNIVSTESSEFNYAEDNFIYGETPCITVKQMLDNLDVEPGDLFVDLGSGRGLTVFYAHFLKKLQAHGYELLPSFIRKARNIKNNLGIKDVKFFQKDFLYANLKEARVVYIAGTTFDEELTGKLIKLLKSAKKGTYIITLSYPLPEKNFILFREQVLLFSWGKTHVYYHKKR